MDLEFLFNNNKTKSLSGRYITLSDIEPILLSLNQNNNLSTIGQSVLNKPVYQYKIGFGSKKILLWSQMHGNESTTTKALFDFLYLLNSNTDFSNQLLQNFTFCCLPMLNPDGSFAYTRENANNIDLNRDFQSFSQPESQLLMQVFNEFKPNYCYNLHDQRTIYGAGISGKPATVSFLAPAYNQNREYNTTRTEACSIINVMNATLQSYIPGQIGRFDDTFNNNCCGDRFQELGVPTILFEAGHFQNDYFREMVRKFIFFGLISSFECIIENNIVSNVIDDYLSIPQNKVNFCDILIKNVNIDYENNKKIINIAIQFNEKLINGKIEFISEIVGIGEELDFFGHIVLDADNEFYIGENDIHPVLNSVANFTIVNKIIIKKGMIKNLKIKL